MRFLFAGFLSFSFLILFGQEYQIRNITQLTDGGDNAEAYFSFDNSKLTMQITNPDKGVSCDQIFLKDLNNKDVLNLKRISTGMGRTTCSYFLPDGKHILYASTHNSSKDCPEPPKSQNGKYLWAVYPEFDIFVSDLSGKIVKQLTDVKGYDAEAVVSPDGKKICFTSTRSGDLELWTMDIDGSNLKQVTNELGYDGGAFFSFDSKRLIFRASRPKTPEEIQEYKSLLSQNLVMPTKMELFMCNVDGSNLKQITHLGKANWSPYPHPDGKHILFSSNHHSTKGYDFQIYMIDTNGQNLRQITYQSNFNAFPMFSSDGKKLVFSSNRVQKKRGETNVYIADWIDIPDMDLPNLNNQKNSIAYLASDELEGRLAGSIAERLAADFIEKKWSEYQIPALFKDGYRQAFDYKVRPNPHATFDTNSFEVNANNVVAFIDNHSDKTIVIGAHYDHIGRNEHNNSSKKNSTGEIHNGADDNASGVAALIELGRILKQNNIVEKTNFILAAFSGEEDGLMGSKALGDQLAGNYKISAMLNMDMLGRLDSMKNLQVTGIGTSDIFHDLVERVKPAGFNLTLDSSGIGPTDHTSFYKKNIPVLNFFTGTHNDYHKPSDDADKINYEGLRNITQFVYNVALELSNTDSISFFKTKSSGSKSVPKYKVTLGIMPDYKDYGDGLHVEGVTDDRPASKAGIKEGDVLIQLGECSFKEVYGYMECLAKFNAGDTTTVKLKRKGEELTMPLSF